MERRSTLRLIASSLSIAALGFAAGGATAQSMQSVAGTYAPVTVPAYGDHPRGQLILTPAGRYSIVLARAAMPKIAAGVRTKGTAEENKAVVDGSIAHVGRYTIDDGGKTITFHIEMSTFPNWDGTTQKRDLKVSGDTLTYVVSTPSGGGPANEVTWKRIK